MAFMKFYVGNEANASSHRDGIYIAIDTKKIFYNGDAYGGSEVDLSNYYTIDQVDSKIGTNVYTGANYISKETNLTDAVLQLDTEIKATNDNLALEHTNAEATYAKKTELGKKLDISTYTSDKATFALKSEIPDVSNFLTISNAQSTYLTKTDARNTYQPKGNYLTSVSIATISDLNSGWDALLKAAPNIPSLNGYATQEWVNGRGFLTKTTADGYYQPKGNYLTSVSWDNVTGKPSFATVATSGSYNDLTDKPDAYTLPTATSSQLGGVKIGEGITIQADGTISAADDVVTLANLFAAKGDIAAMCAIGPFTTKLYFINPPVTAGPFAGIDTGDYYHLCVTDSGRSSFFQTSCSTVADAFPGMDKYFVIKNTEMYLKNNVIYHATRGTDAGYFVSNERGDTLTNVASRFETLAEARAFMREKMLALPDISIVTCTLEEYESGAKDENTLYFITEG